MGVTLIDLWMPILLGSALAWIASALIHMLLKYHNSDYRQLSNEAEVAAALKQGAPQPGVHSIPYCVDMSQMGDPAMQQRFKDGPVAFVAVFPNGMPNMGKLVGQQFLHFLFGCALIAWIASLAIAPGTAYLGVFQFIAPIAFLTFGWASIPYSIWYGHTWSTTAKYLFDALIYALVIAGSFAWLWPAAG
ncbi:hypothetical protein [Pseudomarimonas salicorniae]|uniref:MAPEG family protein n=1 Tax=Pseudomarimonas salicorniae TaxID=2933270 RepID=A0ABT0GIA9_9GAMM|nr:hypothetical protein [Lysobacter sp. CAU 1642]MCK7594178.1 hypothetical protein [Lysobacter sp. CAU 1642]